MTTSRVTAATTTSTAARASTRPSRAGPRGGHRGRRRGRGLPLRRQKTLSGRNCTEIRGPAWATFGTACSQVRWQEPPMTTRSPWPISTEIDSPPPRGRRASRRGSPTETMRDHRVLALPAADRVAVPGDAVAAVAVVAAAGGHERLAETGEVVGGERLAGLVEQRVGERVADAVGVHEPRHVDDPVVHLPPLGPPRHVADQRREHVVGRRQPVAAYVDPRAAGQHAALDAVEGRHRGRAVVEQGALEVHDAHSTTCSNMCSSPIRLVRRVSRTGRAGSRPPESPRSR